MKSASVRFVPRPTPGEDGLAFVISPQNVLFKRNGQSQLALVYVDVYSGAVRLDYGSGAGRFLCSTLQADDDGFITEGLKWTFINDDDGRFCYRLRYYGSSAINNLEVPFTVTLGGKNYKASFFVSTVADGDRGPALRGPMDWNACALGFHFESGGQYDTFLDLVIYGMNCFACAKNHTKTADNYPGSQADIDEGLWTPAEKVPLIISDIIIAQYALVKNLGVETIDMRDAAGNILFQAKDGNVTCRTGTFENVVVSGLVRKKKTVVTAANFGNIFKVDQTHNDPDMGTYAYEIDFDVCGTWLEFQFLPGDITIYPKGHRDLCGNTVLLYNKTSHTVGLSGNSAIKSATGPSPTSLQSFALQPDRFASIDFKIGAVNNKETAYFEVQFGTINNSIV